MMVGNFSSTNIKFMSKSLLITLLLAIFPLACLAQAGIVGKWKSIDDKTGDVKSIVEVIERGTKVYGKIIKIFPKIGADVDPICTKCPPEDERFKKKIIGMEIMKDLIKDGNEYSNGHILDPEVGKIYRCKIWLEKGTLKVRGYLEIGRAHV